MTLTQRRAIFIAVVLLIVLVGIIGLHESAVPPQRHYTVIVHDTWGAYSLDDYITFMKAFHNNPSAPTDSRVWFFLNTGRVVSIEGGTQIRGTDVADGVVYINVESGKRIGDAVYVDANYVQ